MPDAKIPAGVEGDEEFEVCWLLDRQVAWFRTFQDLVRVLRRDRRVHAIKARPSNVRRPQSMAEDKLLERLQQIEQRLAALEEHAAAAAEVLAHAEQMLAEWQELSPVLREIKFGERRGRG